MLSFSANMSSHLFYTHAHTLCRNVQTPHFYERKRLTAILSLVCFSDTWRNLKIDLVVKRTTNEQKSRNQLLKNSFISKKGIKQSNLAEHTFCQGRGLEIVISFISSHTRVGMRLARQRDRKGREIKACIGDSWASEMKEEIEGCMKWDLILR